MKFKVPEFEIIELLDEEIFMLVSSENGGDGVEDDDVLFPN